MTQTVPQERVRIFDRQGFPLAEFTAKVSRSWAIGREGRASFTYPTRKTDVVNERNLQYGNYLLVENSRLPAWVGVIDLPRSWENKSVEVNAFTLERLFQFRRGGIENKLTGSAGDIFAKMIGVINSAEQTILETGNIWTGGSDREETLTPSTMDNNLRQLQERSLEEYYFTPQFSGGKLVIKCDWVYRLGNEAACTLIAASRGGNLEDPTMNEDGEIINDVLGYGDGMTWESRPRSTLNDLTSISKYGLRQKGMSWNGVTQPATIDSNNFDVIQNQKEPRYIFPITALNVGDTFDYIKVGNVLGIQTKNIGFSNGAIGTVSKIRILGMSYNPTQKNKIKLAAEKV